MVITMKEHLKAVLSVLCVMILIPELLLISEGRLCNRKVERFYRKQRRPENEAALSMVHDWVCTAKGVISEGNVQSTMDLYQMLDPSFNEAVDHIRYSNLAETINDISAEISMKSNRRRLRNNRELKVRHQIAQFWTALNVTGHSMATREAFGKLIRLGFRYGVLGDLEKQLHFSDVETQQTLQAFFDTVTGNLTLLSKVLGTALPAQTFGLVVSLQSTMRDELNLLQFIAPDLVAAIHGTGKVASIIMLPLHRTVNDTPTHYTLQDAADLQRFYNDVSHLKPASPGHDVCTEQGFAAIRSVLENSTPHSSILLISDTPPDPDQRDEVLSVVIAKDLQLHFVLAEGGCISTADDEFDAYRRLAATTGGTVLNSIPSVPNLFAFLMASRAKTPFVSITTAGSPITRIRVPALDDERHSNTPDYNGQIPFIPSEETFRMLQASAKCHDFLVTALDTDVNVVAVATEDNQALFLQEPGLTTYLRFFGPDILNLSLHSPTPGRWRACSQKDFELQIGCSQLFDFSVEYLRYRRRAGFRLTRPPKGCGDHKVVIQSPRMHLIGDSCPLEVHMYHMSNGSFFHSVPLLKCTNKSDGFLQARLQLIPMPLTYRISGCDVNGIHFEKVLLTPFFSPRVAMVSITPDPSEPAEITSPDTSAIFLYRVQNMDLVPATVTFKVQMFEESNVIVEKVPKTLDLGAGESGQVSFIFKHSSPRSSNESITGMAVITPRLTTDTIAKKSGCSIKQRLYQQNITTGRNDALKEGDCGKRCQNASCSEEEVCLCDPQYTGKHCETPICTLPCQNNGQCVAPNTCKCPEGFTGENCEAPICEPSCQNGGQCVSPDTCECPLNYTGSSCMTPICSQPCENGGTCVAPDTCNCAEGYAGESCETPICDPPCENGGTCNEQHRCKCDPRYTGPSCSSPICKNACLHGGTCTSPDTCACIAGYTGMTCGDAVCKEPCRNGGECTAPDVCSCADGYMGDFCEVPTCSTECKNNGTCVDKDECLCTLGYSGRHCETAICASPCMNGGTCVEPDTCSCPSNYTGSVCGEPVCMQTCLNGGRCTAPGSCTCTQEFIGESCEVPFCEEPCQNGGTCTSPNVCTCEEGYKGDDCGMPICSPPCLNDGLCTNDRTCQCIQYYSGQQCEERLCSDYDHHVAFMDGIITTEGNRRLVIFPSGNDSVKVTISGETLSIPTVQIHPDAPYTLELAFTFTVSNHRQRRRGLFVHAADGKRVKVLVVNEEPGSIDVASSLPTVFPREGPYAFYALSVDSTSIQNARSTILLVGAYDNTTINVTVPHTLIFERILPESVPFSIRLNQGETYLIHHPEDLTGTYIESDKWLTVYSGHECAEVPSGRVKCDHLVDQLPPLKVWGKKYVVGALETQAIGHQLKMLAGVGSTMVRVHCFSIDNGTVVADLTYNLSSTGESVVISIPGRRDCIIAASEKILVALLAQGQGQSSSVFGDPFLTFVPSIDHYVPRSKFTTITAQDPLRAKEMKSFINIIVEEKWFNADNITLDGVTLSDRGTEYSSSRLVAFSPGLGESYAIISMEVTPGLHSVEHVSQDAQMAVLCYGFANHWSYGYWTNTEEALSCDQFMP